MDFSQLCRTSLQCAICYHDHSLNFRALAKGAGFMALCLTATLLHPPDNQLCPNPYRLYRSIRAAVLPTYTDPFCKQPHLLCVLLGSLCLPFHRLLYLYQTRYFKRRSVLL